MCLLRCSCSCPRLASLTGRSLYELPLPLVAERGLLMVVASLVMECGVSAHRLQQLQLVGLVACPTKAYGILIPWPWIQLTSPALESRFLNHWTNWEVPQNCFFKATVISLCVCVCVTNRSLLELTVFPIFKGFAFQHLNLFYSYVKIHMDLKSDPQNKILSRTSSFWPFPTLPTHLSSHSPFL